MMPSAVMVLFLGFWGAILMAARILGDCRALGVIICE